jgi:hypothetical protein
VKLSFDTGYSYDGENGETCTELHAMLIVQIGNWLDSQGVSWKWMNEYTGDVHESYAGLKEFLGEGDKAKAWFTGSVMPLIKRLGEDS